MMYKCFNVEIPYWENDEYYNEGIDQYKSTCNKVQTSLNQFKDDKGTLIASKLTAKWFPSIESDVFISHSHKDKKLAITIAGFLFKSFRIRSFVDSCVWNNADELLKAIDLEYSKIQSADNKHSNNENTIRYDYDKRNLSTSHVHMMLSTALSNMIDVSECIFFLNTPHSIRPSEVVDSTYSPWIYSEISMTRLIRQKKKRESIHFGKTCTGRSKAILNVLYDLDLSHLIHLDKEILETWLADYQYSKFSQPLEGLYQLCDRARNNYFL